MRRNKALTLKHSISNVHSIQIFMLLIKFLNTKLWLKFWKWLWKRKWVYYSNRRPDGVINYVLSTQYRISTVKYKTPLSEKTWWHSLDIFEIDSFRHRESSNRLQIYHCEFEWAKNRIKKEKKEKKRPFAYRSTIPFRYLCSIDPGSS